MALIKWKNIYSALKFDAFQIWWGRMASLWNVQFGFPRASDIIFHVRIQWIEKRIFNAKNLSRAEVFERRFVHCTFYWWLVGRIKQFFGLKGGNNAQMLCKLIYIEERNAKYQCRTVESQTKQKRKQYTFRSKWSSQVNLIVNVCDTHFYWFRFLISSL